MARTGLAPIRLALAATLLAGCHTTLQSDLDEAQADEVVLALDRAGVRADKVRERELGGDHRFRVDVPSGEVASALAVLRDLELPRRPPAGLREAFPGGGLLPSPFDERARYEAALSGELTRSLLAFEGVRFARVHLALPPPGARLDEDATARASVLLKHRADQVPDPSAVRALVAGAVPDLAPEEVAVVALPMPARPPPETPALVDVGPIRVTAASAPWLRGLIAATLALHLILAAALAWSRARQRRRDRPAPPP